MRSCPPRVQLWTPLLLPNLVAWYDASNAASISQSGGSVSQWNDLSGNANHLTSVSTQPMTGVDTVNGLNAIKFISGKFLNCTSLSATPATRTWLAVVKVTSLASYQAIVGPSVNGGMEWRIDQTTGVQDLGAANTAGVGTSSTSVGTVANQLGVLRVDGGAYSFRLNGASDGSGTSATTWSGGGTLQVGAIPAAADPYIGDMCELLGGNAIWAGSDLSSAEAYYRAKWGTP